MKRPAQITGHQIDHHGHQHQNHAEPDAPVPMRASPIRRLPVVNRATIRISVRLVFILKFIHKMRSFRQPLPRSDIVGVIKIPGLHFCERRETSRCRLYLFEWASGTHLVRFGSLSFPFSGPTIRCNFGSGPRVLSASGFPFCVLPWPHFQFRISGRSWPCLSM